MKLSLIILFAILSLSAFRANSQMSADQTAPETIVSQSPLSKSDQWHNLKRWVALTFDNSNVIDMEDEQRGTMVIKWSCPVKLDSECINATAISTYLIDVRDGKYRLQRINPRISFQFIKPDVYEEFDQVRAAQLTFDIRLIIGIAPRVFGGAFVWPADERYDEIIAAYREDLSGMQQYRTDRDRERGKISDDWKKAEHNWQLIRTPLVTLRQLDASMVNSLNNALTQNDDF